MRGRETREPAVFDRDSVVRGALLRDATERDVVARDDVARRGLDAARFVADERVARLGVGFRGVMADPQSLTSLRHSSQADHGKLTATRDQLRQLQLTPEQLSTDRLKRSRFHFPEPFPLRLLQ